MTPYKLLNALLEHGTSAQLHDVELLHIHLEGEAKWNDPKYEGMFSNNVTSPYYNMTSL